MKYETLSMYDANGYMVKTYESRIPPSPKLDKVTGSFDKFINTDIMAM